MLDTILSVIAPHDCLSCSAEGRLLCSDCLMLQKPAESRCYRCHLPADDFTTCSFCSARSPLVSVRTAYRYESQAKDLVWKLKFGRSRAAAAEIAELMAPLVPFADTDRLIITHVPTATSRVRMRGYDQAALIARSLAAGTGLPHTSLLKRSGQRKQVGASRSQRLHQLSGSFRPVRARHIQGAHILLVDDVVTTGATLQAAARVLKEAGAGRIDALAFAQA